MRQIFSIIALGFLSLIMLTACNRNDEESNREATVAVKKIMAQRKQAIETKDFELYKSLILPEYDDGKSRYQDQIDFMQSAFERYEKIQFTYQKSTVDLKMNSARMVGKISYKPSGAEKPVWDHEVTLFRRVDGKWYISGGVSLGLF